MSYIKKPEKIEDKSFVIIEEEMDKEVLKRFSEEELLVVKRVIHATADFEYAEIIKFVKDPISKAKETLKNDCIIYTDTNMIKSGINKGVLKKLNAKVVNYVSDEDVIEEAKKRNTTRSIVSIEKAIREDKPSIFVIGNAPTALYSLMEHIKEGKISPDLVIACPIGFVGAEESKKDFENLNMTSVITRGRKGGSTVCVAIVNALMYLIQEREGWKSTNK